MKYTDEREKKIWLWDYKIQNTMYTIGKQKEILDALSYNHYLVTTFFPEKLFIRTINQGETPDLIFSGKEIESVKYWNTLCCILKLIL